MTTKIKKTGDKIILVLEDELPLQTAIRKKLELAGFQVLTARSADQATDYLKEVKVDAVWLDHYLLGKENGLDFVVNMKNNKEYKKIPVFVVSNTVSPEKIQSYLKFGVEKYYTKANYRLDEIIEELSKKLDCR